MTDIAGWKRHETKQKKVWSDTLKLHHSHQQNKWWLQFNVRHAGLVVFVEIQTAVLTIHILTINRTHFYS